MNRSDELLPPPLSPDTLRVIPLGGLGEIGRNMTLVDFRGHLLVVDCGILFPAEHQPGVDVVLPDFTVLLDRWDDVEAVILTHGHEDHIGGVPYALSAGLSAPLVGSRFTLSLLEAKLSEYQDVEPEFRVVADREIARFGPFECQFFAVNHSIPDAMAVSIRTEAGLLFHTGDFKMDQLPLDGRLTDLPGFYMVGDQGVDLLLSDSTNASVPGIISMERDIGPVLARVIGEAQGRVITACTSSHVHRVQQVLDAAARNDRHVALVGRSMVRNMAIARDLGYLHVPPGVLVELAALDKMPGRHALIVCTGSQAEPMSALSRMAVGEHRPITLQADDTVILASSQIPGNETAIHALMNRLARLNVEVVSSNNRAVHVSGHAARGELLHVLHALRPRNFMPVHGEDMHLRAHGKLAELAGMRPEQVVIARDGVVVDLCGGVAKITGQVPAGHLYVDGLDVGDVGEVSLMDRRILRDEGFIAAIVVVDNATGAVVAGPDVSSRGFVDEPGVLDRIQSGLRRDIDEYMTSATVPADAAALQRVIRRSVGRQVSDLHRRRPMILAFVLEA